MFTALSRRKWPWFCESRARLRCECRVHEFARQIESSGSPETVSSLLLAFEGYWPIGESGSRYLAGPPRHRGGFPRRPPKKRGFTILPAAGRSTAVASTRHRERSSPRPAAGPAPRRCPGGCPASAWPLLPESGPGFPGARCVVHQLQISIVNKRGGFAPEKHRHRPHCLLLCSHQREIEVA